MARIDLETYYKGFFLNPNDSNEILKEINRSHVISSQYYDIQFGRDSLIYRDKHHNFMIPIEHDLSHIVIISLTYFFENNKSNLPADLLKERISKALDFLMIKYQFL